MLLGIVLHASLSFFPSFWMVADRRQEPAFGILFAAIHGFRMPLFFVMSGFFSAMLLQRRGRLELVKHRYRRVFLPLLLGMVTIIPLTNAISGLAMSSAPSDDRGVATPGGGASTLWGAARAGDLDAIERHLAAGESVNAADPEHGGTALQWAAAAGRAEAIERLIERGADVNATGRDGGTALHASAFLGHERAVEALIRGGADVNAVNGSGATPLSVASLDEGTTRYFASLLRLELDEDGLGRRKAAIAEVLRARGATAGAQPGLAAFLTQMPVFGHLWFLWFLWWLVLGYAAVSALAARLPTARPPGWLVLSPARYLWLVPLTMVPQAFMGGGDSPGFGPDTSTSLLPIPQVLAYYAIFFGFGALYFGFDDREGRVGGRWWAPLAIGLLVVLPLGLALAAGWDGPPGVALGPQARRGLAIFLQAAYPWLLTFGLMGLFRRACPAESPGMRYLSDSAYWLYLAHLPLVVALQYLVRDWPIPAVLKFAIVVAATTGLLLWSYRALVRYTWLGRFLNGPRVRPEPAATPAVVA